MSTRFACCIASGAKPAISAAQACASASVPDPVGHSGLQRDVGGEPFSAASSMPRARPCADQRGQPADAPVIQRQTIFRDGKLEVRSGATTRRSQIIARMTPAPMAGPLIAPMTGIGCRVDGEVQRQGLVGQLVGHAEASLRSAPALNTCPAPVSTIARTSSVAGLLDRFPQLVDELAVQRVAALGPLQLQGHDVAGAGNTDHGGPRLLASSREPDRCPAHCAMPCWTRVRSSAGTAPPLHVRRRDDVRARAGRRPRAAAASTNRCVTGEGTVFGRRVAVVACEFDFLAGSIGVAAAERITAAVERATAERLPLLASPSSGGTRMQEGTVAFLQMVKIAAAVELHKQRAPALPRLPAPSDHRRGVRVVGLARPRHGRRTGRADRLPRPAGVRAPLRRAVPGGRSDRREPAPARRHRRRRPARELLRSTLDRR